MTQGASVFVSEPWQFFVTCAFLTTAGTIGTLVVTVTYKLSVYTSHPMQNLQ